LLLKKAEKRHGLATGDYARLAAFRQALREFLHFSEEAAERLGLTAQHYQAMLILRSCEEGAEVSINDLARHLFIKHNSAVGLVDRLGEEKLVVRKPSATDRRKVALRLSPRGRRVLAQLASTHRAELERIGRTLATLIVEVNGKG
jgi:DNA-binding MarR family transcriptional regulator